MVEGLLFANARAKAKEQNLISDERLKRMMEAESLDDAVRVLYEINYAGGLMVKAEDYQDLLKEEERLVEEFVKEVSTDKMGLICFFLKNDYHNAKVVIKEKYGNIDNPELLFLPEGSMQIAKLREQIGQEKGCEEDGFLKIAVHNIDEAFLKGYGSPRIIDTEVDKAMFCDIKNKLEKVGDKYIKKYFLSMIDCTNILSLLRTIKIGANYSFFESNFVEGGRLQKDFFDDIGIDAEKLQKEVAQTDYSIPFEKVKEKDFSLIETEIDNFLLEIFHKEKADMFSLAPLIGYYLGKLNEIKVIRVILVCLKNQVAKEEMKKRVRNLYF